MVLPGSVNIADFFCFVLADWFVFFPFPLLTAGISLFVQALRQAGLCESITLRAEEPDSGHAPHANTVISWHTGNPVGAGIAPV